MLYIRADSWYFYITTSPKTKRGKAMSYCYSQLDKDNRNWFTNDTSINTLCDIRLLQGKIRGLYPCSVTFEYPITAIAGRNGSGKSTILAIACCAYHNRPNGYTPFDRSKNYYTFSDFFVSTYDEEKPEGLDIVYGFRVEFRNRAGQIKTYGVQRRRKRLGGKWNDYNRRVPRNVIFFGIQRIVPPSERKTERSYSSKFKSTSLNDNMKQRILEIAGRIMGKKYSSLDLRKVDQRRLFVVDYQTRHYSGFNMGAGENAVFSILIELFLAGNGSLIVIDEIELGLHAEAQKRLIAELKQLCKEFHCQIICSTHSSHIIDALPPEGRKFIETYDKKSVIITGISSKYAMGMLSGVKTNELVILVEDEVGETVLREILTSSIRNRVKICPIGSDQAVLRQLAAHFREKDCSCIAFLDGDKHAQQRDAKLKVKNHLERRYNNMTETEFDEWLCNHLSYLPGSECPEKWLLHMLNTEIIGSLATVLHIDTDTLQTIIEQAVCMPTHQEMHYISEKTGLQESQILIDIVRQIHTSGVPSLCAIAERIKDILDANGN